MKNLQSAPKIHRVALLCPGPSLAQFPDFDELERGTYAAVIGVNRAAGHAACDYWVLCDNSAMQHTVPAGRPTLVCDPECRQRLQKAFPATVEAMPWRDRVEDMECLQSELTPGRAKWWHFSATSALILAWRLGATEIVCYGVDWQGVEDWDGHTHLGMSRNEERWTRECQLWTQVVDLLARRDVTVTRKQIENTQPAE